MTWDREKDALIARVAEGLEIEWHRRETLHPGICLDIGPEDFCVKGGLRAWEKENWSPVSAYNTDIVACLRAAEAWRKQGKDNQWILESPITGDTVVFDAIAWGPYGKCANESGPTASEALAAALYRACGGTL